MLNRLQLNRSISVQFGGQVLKDGQASISDANISNLSPPIQPDIHSFSALFNLTEHERQIINSSNEDLTSNSQADSNISNNDLSKKCVKKGDYIIFESNSQSDSLSTAFNTKTNKIFYWKKFDEKDYMKKLEAYFIMEGASDKIYKFKEIILDSNLNTHSSTTNYAYVFYEPHFGDLHSYMKEKKRLDESEAKQIYVQIVQSVLDCHENGIVIRDIKLKKFVFLDQDKKQIGLANLEDCLILDEEAEDDLIKSQQGCPAYVSPEVLNPSQTSYSGRLSDSWSLGIILFTLLIGRYPFHHPTITNMFAKIARGRFQIPPSIPLSLEAKLLLRSLIRVKPEERLLPSEILAHSWLKQTENEISTKINFNFEPKFSSNQVNKIPLGISLSAPSRLMTNINEKVNRRSLLNKSNETNDENDRFVPEIKF